jgi:tetratricopeptide (TPR) repeat protein
MDPILAQMHYVIMDAMKKRALISALVAAIMILLPACPAGAADDFFQFVNPVDPYAKDSMPTEPDWVPQVKDLQFWPDKERQAVAQVLRLIQQKAPGLVARSCNGQPLHLTMADAKLLGASASSTPGLITCAHYVLAVPDMQELFVHEITHTIDCEANLATSKEFSNLVVPYMRSYRATGSDMREPFHRRVSKDAEKYHLASSYAAQNASEALAEYTTAMVLGKWSPPPAIAKYVQDHVLGTPNSIDEKRSLMRQVYVLRSRGHYLPAIALATNALRIDPELTGAWFSMGGCWNGLHEYELALFCAGRGLQQLQEHGCASDDPYYAWGKDIAKYATAELHKQARAKNDFTTPAYIQLQQRSRR